ncbi:hypothetical protein L3X38_020506 [Prunus dulcis]|uniref:Uncharacterized protein n=1 Tax=Prunus dulcis TaxID=3755 RepID=A0AAD4WF80_PRUDU|nr:hypothetical protein L3X38_020506 [Prunus dulcis]
MTINSLLSRNKYTTLAFSVLEGQEEEEEEVEIQNPSHQPKHQKLPQNLFLNDAGQDLAVADHKDELCLLQILLQDFKNRCSIMHFEMF